MDIGWKIDSGRTLDQDSSPARSKLANSQDSTNSVQLGLSLLPADREC